MSDDNKVKLLKIQHALLEALADKKNHAETEENRHELENELSVCLLKYKELVTEIEQNIYLELQDKQNNLSESTLTLEEELLKLEEFESYYSQLIEIQTRFKQTYAMYSNVPLVLSDINRLNIDLYLRRKEAIKAYLVNKKNISDNKKQIEKINEELINEEQKEIHIGKKIAFLDEEIIRRLISSEGRILEIENNQERLKYTSIATEFQNIGIHLEKDRYTGKNIEEYATLANETKEKLMAATISYEVLPNFENKKILDEISLENVIASYQLVMVKFLDEFYTPSKNVDDAIQKRERIKDLLKYRQTYLSNLGIKHAVDPFARLHINEQLEELRKYENNSRTISRLRHTLAELNARIETLTTDNLENVAKLEKTENAISNRKNDLTIEEQLPKFNDYIENITPAEVRVLDNQVVSINDINPNFNYKKCQEVTTRVIKKVHEILTHPEINIPTEKTPELVIEQSNVHQNLENVLDNKKTLEENDSKEIVPKTSIDIFSKTVPFVQESNIEETQTTIKEPQITNFLEPGKQTENGEIVQEYKRQNNNVELQFSMPNLEEDLSETQPYKDIFNDITPFETPTMFTEKIDSTESEEIFSLPSVEVDKSQNSSELLKEIPIELKNAQVSTTDFDFWSTDANINNIYEQDSLTVHRKAI